MSNATKKVVGSGEPLRIACLIDDLGTGGAQRIVTVLAQGALADAGLTLVVISLGTRNEETLALEALGVTVHQMPAGRILSIRRIRKLRSILRSFDPHIIHTHLLSAHILGGVCGFLNRTPVVSTIHNVDPHPRFAGTWKRRAETLCLRNFSRRCLAVGPSVAMSNAPRLGAQHMHVLPNPLSMTASSVAQSGADAIQLRREARAKLAELVEFGQNTRLFLTVGRLTSEKGWPEFVNIFERILDKFPDCLLISVGDGPLGEELEQVIRERGLDKHIVLCGRRDDVARFYQACDVFVLNSIIEGLPMALLEAMAAGLPVVATRVGDVEFALGGTELALVEAGDSDAMVGALCQYQERYSESLQRGIAGSARVAELFDSKGWMQQLKKIYIEVHQSGADKQAASSPANASALAIRKSATTSLAASSVAATTTVECQKPLHVVEMVDGLSSGGAQSLLKLRARHALDMGYRIDVIALRATEDSSELRSQGVTEVHTFPSPHVFDPARIKGICQLLKRLKPDVIHTHLRTSNTVGALCGRLLGIPVVSTLHSIFPEPARAHARRDWAEKWALRLLSSRITAVGPMVRETHQPRFAKKPVHSIPNPVELPSDGLEPALRREQLRQAGLLPLKNPDAKVVFSAARLTGLKGFIDALKIVERVRCSVPELQYVIAGEGEQRASLEAHIRTHGMEDYVTLLGHSDRVRDLMAASDLFLLTSSGEGLPLVLLEAMSVHLPIVATRVGDIPWLLQDGDLGALIEVGDIDGAARAVEVQLMAREAALDTASRAFETVKTQYSVQTWLRDMDDAYRRAIGTAVSASRRPVQNSEFETFESDAFEDSRKYRRHMDA